MTREWVVGQFGVTIRWVRWSDAILGRQHGMALTPARRDAPQRIAFNPGGPKAIYAVLAGDVKRATFVPQCTVDWNRARHNHQIVHQIRCGAFLWVFAGLRTA